MKEFSNDIDKILFTEQQLYKRVKELAEEINNYYKGEPIIAVFVLKGSAFCVGPYKMA